MTSGLLLRPKLSSACLNVGVQPCYELLGQLVAWGRQKSGTAVEDAVEVLRRLRGFERLLASYIRLALCTQVVAASQGVTLETDVLDCKPFCV